MSEFHVTVVRLGPFNPHPNADTLDVTKVFDYTVVAKRGGFKEGDLAVYVPIDSLVPDVEEWHWLAPRDPDGTPRFPVGQVPERYRVIEAKKLRGIFSQGCLSPLPLGMHHPGDDLSLRMGITKHEPPVPMAVGGECEAAPSGWTFPTYTDVEGLRRYPDVLVPGEQVVLTEKIHGCNARYAHDGERLWVGSHNQVKREDAGNVFWQVAAKEGLADKLAKAPMHIFFGEVYGQVQDLKYGVKSGCRFRAFDVWDVDEMRYLGYVDARNLADKLGIDWVPVLYQGPWDAEALNPLAEGKTKVDDRVLVGPGRGVAVPDNVREGFVVRPVTERWDPTVGRVILKRHGEGYLLRKKGK